MNEIRAGTEELEEEIRLLRAEFEKAKEREKDFEETRRAMLYLLEDLNESASNLEKAKNEWEETFDTISDLIFIHDLEMKIVRCNRAYQAASGVPFKEIVGRPYYEIFPRMSGPFGICSKCTSSGSCGAGEEEVHVPSLGKIFKMKAYSTKNIGSQANFIHIMEDVTEERRAAEKQRILYNFTHKMAANLDVDYRLKVVCEAAVEFGYVMAWLGTLKEDTRDIVPMAWAGSEEGYLSSIKVKFDDSALGQGPSGRAVRSRKPEVQNRIAADKRYEPWKEEALKRGYRSSAAFPAMEEDKVIAVLNIYSPEEEFQGRDIEFLQSFANQAASYIKTAMLFREVKESSERIREEMELSTQLLTLSYATAHTTDIDRLMAEVVDRLQNILGGDICLSYLWDRERRAFHPSQAVGLSHEMVPLFRVESLDANLPFVKSALEGKGALMLGPEIKAALETRYASSRQGTVAVSGEADAFRWVEGLNTAIVVPLIGKEDYLGLLICVYTGPDARFASGFTERDKVIVDGISYQVSTALEEARLYKLSIDKTMELSRKVETIQTMHEIDRSILSTLEPEEILDTAIRMVAKIIFCEMANIALVDREREGFVYAAGFGLSFAEKGQFLGFKGTNAAEVVKTGRPQYIPNMTEIKEPLMLERAMLQEGFISLLRVPILTKGTVIGVFAVGARRPSAFTSEDLSIAEKLSSQIGVALENARLLTDLNELFFGTVKTLSEAIDAKSPWTGGHSERVTEIALEIGREVGLDEKELKDLELAGLLHDIGKLGTYESILDKPGRLTEEELKLMRQHPKKGAEILEPIRQMRKIIPAIKHHHECYDGTGYPDGLKGEEIPLMARILTVADTVDAMGADRPYRKGKSMDEIAAELKRCSGTQFDPSVVNAFLRTLGPKGP